MWCVGGGLGVLGINRVTCWDICWASYWLASSIKTHFTPRVSVNHKNRALSHKPLVIPLWLCVLLFVTLHLLRGDPLVFHIISIAEEKGPLMNQRKDTKKVPLFQTHNTCYQGRSTLLYEAPLSEVLGSWELVGGGGEKKEVWNMAGETYALCLRDALYGSYSIFRSIVGCCVS